VWRRNDGTLQEMLFTGDAPWSCVRDGIYFSQTTMPTPLVGVTQQTNRNLFALVVIGSWFSSKRRNDGKGEQKGGLRRRVQKDR
jgi:hypothetical protein